MDFGKLIVRSFEVTRRYRALWLFGILLALTTGGGANANFGNFGGGGGGRQNQSIPGGAPRLPDVDPQMVAVVIGVVVFVVIVLVLVGIVVRLISRGALVGLVADLERDQTAPAVRRGFAIGSERFGSLFRLALLVNIPLSLVSFLLLLTAALPVLAALLPALGGLRGGTVSQDQIWPIIATGVLGSMALLCCVLVILFAASIVIQPIYEFAVRACVIGKNGARDGLREGYRVVRSNVGNVVILYILTIGIAIGWAILMIPVVLLLFGLVAAIGFGVGIATQAAPAGIVAGAVVGIPVLLLLLFLSGLYQTFLSTLWTETFLAMTAPPPPAPATVATATA